MGGVLQTRASTDPDTPSSPSRDRILAIGLALLLVLGILRAGIMGLYGSLLRGSGRILLACFGDFLYVAILTAIFVALDAWARARTKGSRGVARVWLAVATFSVLAALLNREVVPIFGRPFTYQWLYYSDFLQGQDAKNAIRWFLSVDLVALWVATSGRTASRSTTCKKIRGSCTPSPIGCRTRPASRGSV